MNLSGKTTLVTGGSSGIGEALVRALAAAGARVLTCGRNEAALARSGAETLACDLATRDGRASLVEWVGKQTDALDLLVHNAGVQHEVRIDPDLDEDAVEQEIATNLLAPIALTAALLPLLERGREPVVVQLSSGLAIAPKASAPVYCATKAALSNFSRGLRFQLEPKGIRVVDVVTPLVKTPMTAGRHDGAMEVDDFVAKLLRGLAAGKDEIYVGKARLLPVLLRLAPNRARNVLRNG